MDFIPNHTSDKHPWFLASKNGSDPRENEFRSYYVWAPGRGDNGLQLPNSWTTVDECAPAWKINDDNFFYLHQFMESQPELNLRSAKVREEMEDILRFWLDLGVDGFYIRDADYLFEDYDLRDQQDNVTSQECGGTSNRKYTKGLTEVFDMLARWRAFLDDYGNETSQTRIMFADVDGSYEHVMNYYGLFSRDGVHFPLNKFSLQLNITAGGQNIKTMVSNWMANMPKEHWPNWMGGDDRSERLADRLGENAGPYLILAMLLPGTPYFYYGDEIGLQAVNTTNGTQEHTMALPMRGPMQWSNTTSAGFCFQYCVHQWMKVHPEYKNQMNVEAQKRNPESIWNLFHNLTLLRNNTPSFEYGDYIPAIQDDEVFSFVREYDGKKGYLVALNFAGKDVQKDFRGVHPSIPASATVEIVTGKGARHTKSGSAHLNSLALAPFEGIVVSWDYKAKEL
ncbi:unnamed protein product [Candidula unifasciata]|uniref:Glycosyl hydrolase family 13 catalytic domain-containing protein n=1 Tax=Candidula unifasciata TaxID=100452 RepID=A0A8S3ZBC0_9EUPU|nr:unnamed protein product [Candidula unifasciata]